MKCIRIYTTAPGIYLKVMADLSVRYRYDINGSGGDYCQFPTWGEVGEPYQAEFDDLIDIFGLVIMRGLIRTEDPYVVDTLENDMLPDCPKDFGPDVLSVEAVIGGQVVNVTIADVELVRETQ